MKDIILNEEKDSSSVLPGCNSDAIIKRETSELDKTENNEPIPLKANKKKTKQPRTLVILSLIFTIISIPCALLGLLPFQLLFLGLGLIFYIIDRKKNGKRGISLFGMICTLVTFIIIFTTLVYSFLLLGIGIYTVYINPEPYNFVMGTLKGFVSWFLGLFGINFSF